MPSHPVRHPHLHHHIHQPAMHPQHPPPVGMNVTPQVPPPQQQHHIQAHGGPPPQVSQYISHQWDQNRVGHHHQQRMGQQVHQPQLQAKSRANLGHSGLLISSMQQPPPQQSHQTQNQIQTHIQQKQKPQTNPLNHLGTPSNPGSVHSVAQHHHQQQKQTSQGIAPKPQRILQHNDKRAQNMQTVTQQKTITLAQKPSLHQQSQQQPQQPQQQPQQKQPPLQQQQPPPSQQQQQKPQQPQTQPQLPQQQQVNQTQQHQQQQQQAQDTNKDMLRGINLQSTNETLANIKEKTSMCLVNELARYNKIQHQYRLTGEQGPAHSKKFTVTLKLGDEEYTADGPSIKKAQHSAAGEAISKTKYEHPPAKTNRIKTGGKGGSGNITPTVELNALAMKLGEPAIYVLDSVQNGNNQTIGVPHNSLQQSAQSQNNPSQNYYENGQYGNINRNNPNSLQYQRLNNFRGRTSQRGGFSKFTHQRVMPFNGISPIMQAEPCRITLIVGMRKFLGVGPTLQAARHDAAARALEVLKPLVVSDITPEQSVTVDVTNSDLKSPISLVHEIALKRNLTVAFEVQSERGPPHMKTFVTLCKVGTMVCEGEGNGKKISKKRAAEKMLDELKKLPPVSPLQAVVVNAKTKNLKRKPQPVKKKTRNLIKENAEPDYPEEVNPISKLIQIQQAVKEREPVYNVVEERGAPRRREFVIEVSAGGHTARGTGPNKKMAKRLAAENLLTLMGHTVIGSSNKENNPKTANIDTGIDKTRKVTFQENVETLSVPVPSSASSQPLVRQLVPGLLIMQKNKEPFISAPRSPTKQINKNIKEQPIGKLSNESEPISKPTVAQNGNETSATSSGPNFSGDGVRPKDQLLYLAQLLGFHVQFSDYPKGNHGEYLTIVTLSTDPPQLCHGAGCNTEASQEQASITALRILSELGLDNVKPKKPQQEEKKIKPILTNGLKK